MRGQPDGIAEEVTHGTPLRLDPRFPLSVRRQPGAMHTLQDPRPIGDRGDQRRSGDAPGLPLFPMPAFRVEAQGADCAALGQAPGAEVGIGKRACDRHRGCKQTRRRRWYSTGGLGLPWHWRNREDWLRTAKMHPCLGQKIGKAGDPGPLADDVEKITMQSDRCVLPFSARARPRRRTGQPHEERPARIVLQIAHDPIGPLPPPGGKVCATHALCVFRKSADHIFGLGIHGSTTSACM